MTKNIPQKIKLFIAFYIITILTLTTVKFIDPRVCGLTMIPIILLLIFPYNSKSIIKK